MEHLIQGVRHAVQHESWYAALALSLVLPDACGAIETPGVGVSNQRYVDWLQRYVAPFVTEPHFSSEELFRFRCAFLHEGDLVLDAVRKGREGKPLYGILERVTLYVREYEPADIGIIASRKEVAIPASRNEAAISHQEVSYSVAVADLCEWICLGVEAWLRDARSNPEHANWIERHSNTARIKRIVDLAGTEVPL